MGESLTWARRRCRLCCAGARTGLGLSGGRSGGSNTCPSPRPAPLHRTARNGMTQHGTARHGTVRHGMALHSTLWYGVGGTGTHSVVWLMVGRHDTAWCEMFYHGLVHVDMAWHVLVWFSLVQCAMGWCNLVWCGTAAWHSLTWCLLEAPSLVPCRHGPSTGTTVPILALAMHSRTAPGWCQGSPRP